MKKLLVIAFALASINIYSQEQMTLNLKGAVLKAYESNKLIEKSEIDLDSSDLQVSQAYKLGLPSLSLSGVWADAEDAPAYSTGFKNQLVLTQPIFQGFQVLEGMKSSKRIRTLSEYKVEATKTDVKLQVIESYLNVIRLKKQAEVLDASVKELDSNLERLKKMQSLGMVTKTDVLDLELEKLKLETNLMQAENARDIQLSDLKNKIGIAQSVELKIEEPNFLAVDVDGLNYDTDLNYALENNVNLQMAKLNSQLAKSSEAISRAKLMPNVAFQGTYGNQSFVEDFDDSLDPDNYNWSVGISFNYNIFSFGKNVDGLNIAKNDTKKAVLDEELAKENIELLLKSTYLNLLALDKQVEASKNAVINSEENYRLQKKKYDNQMITSIEFLAAENNLRNSKFSLIDSELSFYFNYEKYLSILD